MNLADDLYGNCHHRRVDGVGFTINGVAYTTAGGGIITTLVYPDMIVIQEDQADIDRGIYVYCSYVSTGYVAYDGRADIGGIMTQALFEPDGMVCDWYNLIASEETGEPDNGGDNGSDTPQLPETGVGQSAEVSGAVAAIAVGAGAAALLGRAIGADSVALKAQRVERMQPRDPYIDARVRD